jgi:hypothetical protein
MRIRSWLAASGLLVLCAGCDLAKLIGSAETHSQPGRISGTELPDTATHGVPFQIRVTTSGNLCLKGLDRTDVTYVAADTAMVAPYDNVSSGPCGGDALRIIAHITSITFPKTGVAVVRFIGVKDDAGTPTTVERTVTIH